MDFMVHLRKQIVSRRFLCVYAVEYCFNQFAKLRSLWFLCYLSKMHIGQEFSFSPCSITNYVSLGYCKICPLAESHSKNDAILNFVQLINAETNLGRSHWCTSSNGLHVGSESNRLCLPYSMGAVAIWECCGTLQLFRKMNDGAGLLYSSEQHCIVCRLWAVP